MMGAIRKLREEGSNPQHPKTGGQPSSLGRWEAIFKLKKEILLKLRGRGVILSVWGGQNFFYSFLKKLMLCYTNGFVSMRAFHFCIEHRKISKIDGDMMV